MKLLKAIIISQLVAFFPVQAMSAVDQFPDALMYQGKPIDPLCIYEAADHDGTVSLTQCGVQAEKGRKETGQVDFLASQGYFGYEYSWPMGGSAPARGYSYYKPFGMVNNAAIVFAINSGGGSGQFTSLNLIEREGDKIHVKFLEGGDRCNNGIFDMRRESQDTEEHLIYKVNLTPFDFLTLTNDNPHHLKAYDDLEACAACCRGVAVYQRSIGPNFTDEKLLYVNLPEVSEGNAASPDKKYQVCFDNLMKDYQKMGKSQLDIQQLKVFTQQFNAKCFK